MHWIRYHIGVAYMLSPWYHIISCVHIVIKTLYNSKIALKGRIAIKIRKFNNMQFHFSWKFTRCHGVLTKTWGGRGGGGCSTELGRCAATFQRSFRWQLATFSKCFWRARGFQFAFSKRTMRRWLQTHDDRSGFTNEQPFCQRESVAETQLPNSQETGASDWSKISQSSIRNHFTALDI